MTTNCDCNEAVNALREVQKLLESLLAQADEVTADVGVEPTAQEALTWALAEVETMVARRSSH